MRRFCFPIVGGLLAIGWFSPALAQYPGGYHQTGLSSFPVQSPSPTPQQFTPTNGQLHTSLAAHPQVPQVTRGYEAQQAPAPSYAGPYNGTYQATGQPVPEPHGAVYQSQPAPPPVAHGMVPQSSSPAVTGAPMAAGCQSCQTPGGAMAVGSYGYPGLSTGCSGVTPQPKLWFFGANALLFNRVDDTDVKLSFADAAFLPDRLTTSQARSGVAAGFETFFGRYFNCGRNAISAGYWGIFPQEQSVILEGGMPGEFRSRLPYAHIEMPDDPSTAGVTDAYGVYDWYDQAFTHRLDRSYQVHSVEVNLLGFAAGGAARNFNIPVGQKSLFKRVSGGAACSSCGGAGCIGCSPCGTAACGPTRLATGPCCLTPPACGSKLNFSWLAGFRYFRFQDNLLYAASLNDPFVDRAIDDLYYEVNTTNDLVGFQTGGRLDYCLGRRVNLYGTSRVGIFGNHSTLFTRLGTDFQDAMVNDSRTPPSTFQGQPYRFDVSKTNVAFLSELGAGFGVRITPKWSVTTGYTAVIASGVATSVGNIRKEFTHFEEIRDFDNDDVLILHGVKVGALYNF